MAKRITLLPHLSHGRWPNNGCYMPHIVIGDPQQREAMMGGNSLAEKYLGVWVTEAPDALSPGHRSDVTLTLMYCASLKKEIEVPALSVENLS